MIGELQDAPNLQPMALVFGDFDASTVLAREGNLAAHIKIKKFLTYLRSLAKTNRGEIPKFAGDGFLAEFKDISDAMGFIFAIRESLKHFRPFMGDGLSLHFGMHIGEVVRVETPTAGKLLVLRSMSPPASAASRNPARSCCRKQLSIGSRPNSRR